MLAGAVSILALPSAVLAFAVDFAPTPEAASRESPETDGRTAWLARGLPLQSFAPRQSYPFTPANNPNRPDRSVTVAVRMDAEAMQRITVRPASSAAEAAEAPVRIAQTAFNLGVARGYRNFAQDLAAAKPQTRKAELPDLSRFSIAASGNAEEPRFSPRIVIDERPAIGRAPRTFAGDREDQVDLGGSYRVTRNLDVTAGVRYSQDRQRLHPLTDGRQDNQAVYVGTQFRF